MRNEDHKNNQYAENHLCYNHVDKFSHNLALICRHLYQSNLQAESTSSAYSPSDLSLSEILNSNKRFLMRHIIIGTYICRVYLKCIKILKNYVK